MRIHAILYIFIIALVGFSCTKKSVVYERSRISLEGMWDFRLDSLGNGIDEGWQTISFSDSVALPGTTDTNQKGIFNTKMDETTHLSRIYTYTGKAWYKKQVNIPQSWEGKNITMLLERTKPTTVWVDGKKVASSDKISTSQVYDLTAFLSPGNHEITVLVDNGESVPPQIISSSHAYTESTQTNWNGIIGEMYLEAVNPYHIQDVQVYPNVGDRSVLVKVKLSHADANIQQAKLTLSAWAWNSDKQHKAEILNLDIDRSQSELEIHYELGDDALLWSEFDPALYKLSVTLEGEDVYDSQFINFGLRRFETKGTQFVINGNITFLRGKHDACVFPLTAHVAMDVDAWRNYFRIVKEYGINHCRFHSWCPPKACFEAADIEGIYLQAELPFWGTLKKEDERLISFLSREGTDIQKEYSNHASFIMFALGNELFGDQEVMDTLLACFRKVDSRHLYAFGANNFLGYSGQVQGEDFLVTCRIGGEWGGNPFNTHVRGSFSFADALDGGYINHTYPNSEMDFSDAIKFTTVPVISHETAQFQVYPNYKEIAKYTGVLQPRNLEVFKKRLADAGMLDQAEDFFKASGRWSSLLYRADIEMYLRTAGFGGFQLLDLQDYPGQGSAYIGMLDAFMDSKGLISPEEWREFCSAVVPLFVTEKFCWTNSETLSGRVKIANYSLDVLTGKKLFWNLTDEEDNSMDKGVINIVDGKAGLIDLGKITPKISSLTKAQKVNLALKIEGTDYKNNYPLWIYPEKISTEIPVGVTVATKLDSNVISKLRRGEKILFFPEKKQYEKSTVGGLFQTDYWNFRMFKTISENAKKPVSPGTLGILTNPEHPLFNDFPTDFHTNWQWFPIIKNSYPLIMDKMPSDYRPIVQVIDNVERNHKLGLIFEFQVENGKLLVCMSDLSVSMDKSETRQLYHSIVTYMNSAAFNPKSKLSIRSLNDLFNSVAGANKIELLENISYK